MSNERSEQSEWHWTAEPLTMAQANALALEMLDLAVDAERLGQTALLSLHLMARRVLKLAKRDEPVVTYNIMVGGNVEPMPEKAKDVPPPPTPARVPAPKQAPAPAPAPKPAHLPGARRFIPEQAATICRELWEAELEISGEKKADVARRWNIGWSTVVKLQAGESYREATAAVAEEYRALQAGALAGLSQGGANDGVTLFPVLCPEWIAKTKRMIDDGMLDLVDKVGKRLPLANGEKWVFGSLEELAAAVYSDAELRDETVRMRAGLEVG